jgi:SAM-dependent methyltransferase
VVHELPDRDRFYAEASEALRPGGRMLLAEPAFCIREREFEASIEAARKCGLYPDSRPAIRWTRSAVLQKDFDAA